MRRSGAEIVTCDAPKVMTSLQTGSPPPIDAAKTTLHDDPDSQVKVSLNFASAEGFEGLTLGVLTSSGR